MAANSKLSDVFAHIDAQRDSFLSRLIDYVRHPSISAHNVGIREVADLLISMLERLGFETHLVSTKALRPL
jgi:acetylornithine deacetylase/succinyl-diaminopimelate desuccinylase-like protein